ncbi:hypothetical protein HK405_013617 [Cladochytrium tenue]|nr:hypothetical protein HK405_013617 [Cladochytrium tenue]
MRDGDGDNHQTDGTSAEDDLDYETPRMLMPAPPLPWAVTSAALAAQSIPSSAEGVREEISVAAAAASSPWQRGIAPFVAVDVEPGEHASGRDDNDGLDVGQSSNSHGEGDAAAHSASAGSASGSVSANSATRSGTPGAATVEESADQRTQRLRQQRRRAGLLPPRRVRVCALPVRYDQRPEFLDTQLPSEAEGVLSNVEFARRAAAINNVLGAFWTLGDMRGPLRLAALVAPVAAVAALLGVMLGGSPRMVPYAAAGIAVMAVALFAAGAYSYRPDRAVRSVLADWNAVDGPLRGLRWRSVRFTAELPAVSHRPSWVSWVIVLDRLVTADEDNGGEDGDEVDGGGISVPLVDALPLYTPATAGRTPPPPLTPPTPPPLAYLSTETVPTASPHHSDNFPLPSVPPQLPSPRLSVNTSDPPPLPVAPPPQANSAAVADSPGLSASLAAAVSPRPSIDAPRASTPASVASSQTTTTGDGRPATRGRPQLPLALRRRPRDSPPPASTLSSTSSAAPRRRMPALGGAAAATAAASAVAAVDVLVPASMAASSTAAAASAARTANADAGPETPPPEYDE